MLRRRSGGCVIRALLPPTGDRVVRLHRATCMHRGSRQTSRRLRRTSPRRTRFCASRTPHDRPRRRLTRGCHLLLCDALRTLDRRRVAGRVPLGFICRGRTRPRTFSTLFQRNPRRLGARDSRTTYAPLSSARPTGRRPGRGTILCRRRVVIYSMQLAPSAIYSVAQLVTAEMLHQDRFDLGDYRRWRRCHLCARWTADHSRRATTFCNCRASILSAAVPCCVTGVPTKGTSGARLM